MSKLAWRINSSALLFVLLLGGYFWYTFQRPPALVMPASGLLNQSSNHKYDRALRAALRVFQDRTQIQLGLILQNHLPAGKTIEEQALHAFQDLRLGEQAQHKGILLIWSEQERLFKMEVAAPLKQIFPNGLCTHIEQSARTYMLSNAPFALRDFLTEMIGTLSTYYLAHRQTGQPGEMVLPRPNNSHALTQVFSRNAAGLGRGYAASAGQVMRELPPLLPELERTMQADKALETVLRRYLHALELGLGSAQLPLLTEGSRFYRIEKPLSAADLQRMFNRYQKAGPHRIIQQGPLAAAVWPKGAFAPAILLRQNERGLWLVDETKTGAYFYLAEDGSSQPKYQQGPYAFAWQGETARYLERSQAPALPDTAGKLLKLIEQAQAQITRQPKQAESYIKLAELLHFEMGWLEACAPLYEKALQLAPERHDLDWRLIDLYLNTTDINGAERHFMALLKKTPDDSHLQQHYAWFQKKYGADNADNADLP